MDSRVATYQHIQEVQKIMGVVIRDLIKRAEQHDQSKLVSPELEVFDIYTPKLAQSEYNSDEYKQNLKEMGKALDHHYTVNDHHAQHHKRGIAGMSLVQLLEMLCDWKAATLRHPGGDIVKSINENQGRFGYSDELKQIMLNTVDGLNQSHEHISKEAHAAANKAWFEMTGQDLTEAQES